VTKSLEMCRGCVDDFYNGRNPLGVKRCWSFRDAQVVTRWATGTWTIPTTPGAFTEVAILDCRREKGTHYTSKLPPFAEAPVRIRRSKDAP
jgi:hypothetical protein